MTQTEIIAEYEELLDNYKRRASYQDSEVARWEAEAARLTTLCAQWQRIAETGVAKLFIAWMDDVGPEAVLEAIDQI